MMVMYFFSKKDLMFPSWIGAQLEKLTQQPCLSYDDPVTGFYVKIIL